MAQFIQLTDTNADAPTYVNVDHIIRVLGRPDQMALLVLSFSGPLPVRETAQEVQEMLRGEL